MHVRSCFACALLLACLKGSTAHSWIDNLLQVGNASNIGFIRGYQGHIDAVSSFQINDLAPTTQLCKSNQQTRAYTPAFPMLSLAAGQRFVANYSENGHTTKDVLPPDNKPHPGNYTWFLQASDDATPSPLLTLGDLTSAQVLATGSFDDGLCAEDATRGRAGPRQCQSTVQLPTDLSPGIYQVVWLWNFPKVAGVVEMYSSCMDVGVLPAIGQMSGFPSIDAAVRAVAPATTPSTTISPREQADLLIEALQALLVLAKGQEQAFATTPPVKAITPSMTTITKLVMATRRPANPMVDAF